MLRIGIKIHNNNFPCEHSEFNYPQEVIYVVINSTTITFTII